MANTPTLFSAGQLALEMPPVVGDQAWSVYWNDFTDPKDYTAADWTITTTEAGAGSATEAIGNLAHGVLVITNAAGDDDADFLQLAKETFKATSGSRLLFGMRLKVDEVVQSDFVCGLQITDTTPLAVSDGIYFLKTDASAGIDFVVMKNGVGTTVEDVGTMVADTYITLAFEYDGVGSVWPYVNGKRGDPVVVTNLPDDEELTISFGVQNGEAVVKVLSVDYIYAAQAR